MRPLALALALALTRNPKSAEEFTRCSLIVAAGLQLWSISKLDCSLIMINNLWCLQPRFPERIQQLHLANRSVVGVFGAKNGDFLTFLVLPSGITFKLKLRCWHAESDRLFINNRVHIKAGIFVFLEPFFHRHKINTQMQHLKSKRAVYNMNF